MRLVSLAAGSSLAFVLAGCVEVEEPRPMPPVVVTPAPVLPPPGSPLCNAALASWALGERASARVVERATYDSNARRARVIDPGEFVTQEFAPDRLSIYTSHNGRIRDLRCG